MSIFKTKFPTPVFNTPTFPLTLPLSRAPDGRVMAIETILFPGTRIQVLKKEGSIWQITTEEYPASTPLYVDARFLEPAVSTNPRLRTLPSKKTLLERLESLQGTRYFWGGNWPEGIPVITQLYPASPSTPEDQDDLLCRGLDCSGLIYYLTEGITPRNTSSLIHYGENIPLGDPVKPLDLLVWKGHVLIALSETQWIESRLGKGVVISPLKERFEEVREQLHKENKPLFVRRWYPN